MTRPEKLGTRAVAVAVLVAGGQPAFGAGYYLPNQDAFTTAKGGAWVATADSAAAVHYNAAGLTQLERPEAALGAYVINLGTEVTTATGKFRAKSEWQPVPHLYYGMPLCEDLAFGFGINSPFGLGADWGQASPFRTVITEARLAYVSGTAALAWRPFETLSFGLSGSVNHADLRLEQGLGFFPGDVLRFEGEGYSVSGALSVLWQPHEQHSLGLNVASGTSQTLDGAIYSNALPTGPAKFDWITPMRIAAGYSYRPAPGWNLEANVEWLDWDSLNGLLLRAPTAPGGAIPVPFHWESMFIYELGVSYQWDNGWRAAIGYDYNSSATPDPTYNPAVADADRHWLNAGFGRDCEDWSWFLTYQFGYSNRTVVGALPSPAGESANGKYASRHHSVVMTLEKRF